MGFVYFLVGWHGSAVSLPPPGSAISTGGNLKVVFNFKLGSLTDTTINPLATSKLENLVPVFVLLLKFVHASLLVYSRNSNISL
jgi:hypothetical protein